LFLVNTFPIKREGADIRAFRFSLAKLSQGRAMFIFPEGTRSDDGSLGEPKYGIGLLEKMSKAPILPCYVKGSGAVLPRGARSPKFKHISVYFGRPLKFDDKFLGTKKERYMHVAERVMQAIGDLKKDAN